MAMRWSSYVSMITSEPPDIGQRERPSHSRMLSSTMSTSNDTFRSSVFNAVSRSVSLILRVERPVSRKGSPSIQQVTAIVCARSGCSPRSSPTRGFKSGLGSSTSSPSSPHCASTPKLRNSSISRLSPCRLPGRSPDSSIPPEESASASNQ